jgi:hypothetical protein
VCARAREREIERVNERVNERVSERRHLDPGIANKVECNDRPSRVTRTSFSRPCLSLSLTLFRAASVVSVQGFPLRDSPRKSPAEVEGAAECT